MKHKDNSYLYYIPFPVTNFPKVNIIMQNHNKYVPNSALQWTLRKLLNKLKTTFCKK